MTCPICRRKTVHAFRPFCSKRCAEVDLGHWLNESYRVPAEDTSDDSEAEADAHPNRP